MKKLLLTLSATALLFASDKLLPQKKVIEILKATPLYAQLKKPIEKGIVKVRGAQKEGFYIIQIKTPRGRGTIYVTKDKKYTILGRVINNKTKQIVTARFPVNAKVVQKGVLFTFGNGPKVIYLVTDPQCPFCRMMEKMKKNVLSKDYTVRVILFPLPFHKYAKAMSYYILAGKTDAQKAKRLQEILSGSNEWQNFHPTKAQIKKFNEELENAKKAAIELGVRGTPSVYDKNFNPIQWPSLGEKK
jgi:thiol:disulfide interchange protein DsbC